MLMIVITLLYGAAATLGIRGLTSTPRLSLHISMPRAGETRVSWVLPGGNVWSLGIRSGDQVLALAGRPPTPAAVQAWSGRQLTVRTGAGRNVSLDVASIGRKSSTSSLLLLSPWFMLLGTLMYLRIAARRMGRASYALFASAAIALAVAPGADADALIATGVEQAVVPLFAAFFALFFLFFPIVRSGARTSALLLVPALAAGAFGIADLFQPALWSIGTDIWLSVLLAYPCLGIGLIVLSYVRVRDPDLRRGLTIVTVGSVASIAPFLVFYVTPTLVGRPPIIAAEQAIIPLGLLPAAFAYAILRHRTLGVPLLQRWFVHGIIWAGLIAAYTAPTFVVRQVTRSLLPEPIRSLVLTALLVVLINISFRWLHDQLWSRLDRRLFKDRYDYGASLQALSRDLSLAGDLGGFSSTLPNALRRLMNLEFVALLIREDGRPCIHGLAGDCLPDLLATLVQAAAAPDNSQPISVSYRSCNVLLIPLWMNNAPVGHLCLGPKLSGEPFAAADTALLTTLSGHLAAMVRNTQLVDDLSAKVTALAALNERLQRVQEEERACLVADIHDEPLQTAIYLHRQLVSAERVDPALHAPAALSRTLVDQLRAICSAIRPTVLDDLGLSNALDLLTLDLGNRTNVPILLDIEAEVAAAPLPRAVDLVLYRAAQEALNNCLRHGRPTIIRVGLRREQNLLCLSVADDGKGFVVPPHLDRPATAGHIGLAGLSTRVQRAGGRLLVTSTPGTGTLVRVELPFEAGAA